MTPYQSSKTSVTRGERLQLIGLFTLHRDLKAQLDLIEKAAAGLTGEDPSDVAGTLANDRMWDSRAGDVEGAVDELLSALKLQVADP
jgi:hypothetical protein